MNDTHYTTSELVVLTVTVMDDSPQQPRPVLPPLDGLSVVDLDISTNVSLIDNRIHTEVIYTYQLQPRRTGLVTIPPIPVKIDGKTFTAPAIDLTISQGIPPLPSPGNAVNPENIDIPENLDGQDFYVESVVDTVAPYVGQQIIHTFRFYQAIQTYRQPHYETPQFNGFDTVGLPVQEYNLDIGERTYLISEIRTALFPKIDGRITIGSAQLMFPGTYFEKATDLFTEPIEIQVKSLPENPPVGFDGAVGQYEINAWFSPQVAVANQPSTLHIAISGTGNINTLSAPIWPELEQWQTYESLTNISTEVRDGYLAGTRIYERLLVARRIGDLTIPPVQMVYFDPVAAEYQSIETAPLNVQVIPAPTPGPATPTPVPAVANADTVLADSIPTPALVIGPDLFTIPETGFGLISLLGLAVFWGFCLAAPLLTMTGAAGMWFWQKRRRPTAAQEEASPTFNQKTHPALARAMKTNSNNFKIVRDALEQYLSDAMKNPVRGLTQTELVHRLNELGLTSALVNQIEALLRQSDQGQYLPQAGSTGWELIGETETVLYELDRALTNPKK